MKEFVAHCPNCSELLRRFSNLHRIHVFFVCLDPRLKILSKIFRELVLQLGWRVDFRLHLAELLIGFYELVIQRFWHGGSESRRTELGRSTRVVAQHVRKILVDAVDEILPGELAVGVFRRMRQQPPPPIVRRKNVQSLVHEYAPAQARRELPAVVVQKIERFDVIDKLPRLSGSEYRRRKGKGMERDVVLAHELDIPDVVGAFVRPPPPLPFGVGMAVGVSPFRSSGDVFDRGVEPDVKYFAFHSGPRLVSSANGHAPVQIPRNSAVLQTVAVEQPFFGD